MNGTTGTKDKELISKLKHRTQKLTELVNTLEPTLPNPKADEKEYTAVRNKLADIKELHENTNDSIDNLINYMDSHYSC